MTRRVLLIAHRGASAVAPENTRAAIRAAARAGAAMVELDVQMTRDGRLVIFHDDRLNRTSNGRGRLEALPYRQIARLDAGAWFAPRFRGERIPLVSQVIRGMPRHLGVNLELKRTAKRGVLLARLRRLIQRVGRARWLLISSFDPVMLKPLRSVGVPLALICRRRAERSLAQAITLGCRAWHPHYTLVTARRLTRAHAAGLRVHVWTVDDPLRARRLISLGVDGLFTNDPGRLSRLSGR